MAGPAEGEALNEDDDKYCTFGAEYPVCPGCGQTDQDWAECAPLDVHDGTEWKVLCHTCMKHYRVTAYVDITFSTEKVREGDRAWPKEPTNEGKPPLARS